MAWKKDEDGKLIVDDSGNPIRVDTNGSETAIDDNYISTLNSEAASRRKELSDYKSKFDGIDPKAAKEALQKLESIDLSKMVESGEVEKIKSQISQSYDGKIGELTKQLEGSNAKIRSLLVSNAFSASQFIKEKTTLLSDIAEAYFGKNFEVRDGQAVGLDVNGNPIYSTKNPGQLATVDEALEAMINNHPQKDHILRGSGAHGSGTHPNGGQSTKKFNDYTPAELVKIKRDNPQEYERLRQTRS